MIHQLYNPIQNLNFADDVCFLSGKDLDYLDTQITVFPEWILDKYDYRDKKFEMMDQVNFTTYGELKLPCSIEVKEAFDELDKEMQAAFDKGYEGIAALDEKKIFLWAGRIVYGTLFHELKLEKKRKEMKEDVFDLSSTLRERFGMFHLMLQALNNPIEFSERKPWSISLFKLKYSADIFNFRDDAVNLLFTLGINGFGMIVCLQDNGILKEEYQDVIDKTEGIVLHPIQFEELCAKFLYSNYLLQYQPKYKVLDKGNELLIDALPIEVENNLSLFKAWDYKMFGQVLQDYFSPWGMEEKDIMTSEHTPPISYLERGYSNELLDPEKIDLPF